ncbi:hypothetical protein [Micromonospora sp. NPDC049240]|uniref:hypothetical protein n=1 Tax=Micromonospora sp. NPDC049240 TaxID=3155151 RepID=UPI0033C0EA66
MQLQTLWLILALAAVALVALACGRFIEGRLWSRLMGLTVLSTVATMAFVVAKAVILGGA